ncbi:MAG: hypothetical protein J6U08_03915 [Paludibacteraceae bacterium]|nr:hypothetical protein [Paludibacteraceae bacterium]
MKRNIFYKALTLFLLYTATVNAQEVQSEAIKNQEATEAVVSAGSASSKDAKRQESIETINKDITSETAKDLIPTVRFGDEIKVKFGGFLRAEYYVDSREIVGGGDDLFGFFPEDKVYDKNGEDLNAVVRQNFTTEATRFTATVDGPKLGRASSKAYVEFDFSGGNTVNLRLRQAWAKFVWQKGELLFGKAWSPFSDIPFPYVAALHIGVPYRPFNRGEQLRYTFKPTERHSFVVAGVYQTEHKSVLEESSNSDIRQNPTPEFHLQWRYTSPSFSAGLLSEFKSVRPATKVTNDAGDIFKTDEKVNSFGLGYYIQVISGRFGLKTGGVYGQNLSEYFQQGGYAVKSIDERTGKRTYSTSKVTSYWINLSYGKTWAPSVFVGYSKNLGFDDDILEGGRFFGRWQNVDHLVRVAPSIKFSHKQWLLQAELDYNIAAYGTVDYADRGKVKDTHNISGVRGLLAATFFF